MSAFDYSFGIEEEFFLASAATGALIERTPERLLPAARACLGEGVAAELLQSQVELISPVFHDSAEAREVMSRSRRTLAELAQSMDIELIAAGTHPLGVWHEQLITEKRRYDELASDFRIISQRNLVCGLHVHVALPPHVDRVDVMNRAMSWLPLFLALSTSSPFWNGRVTGLLSYRQALYDEWPRSGVPDFFADEADYAAFAARMQRAGAIRDASQLWWAIRPALRYPTLELRIADACSQLDDAIAIATVFRSLIAALVDDPGLGCRRTTHTRRLIDENRWRAKRDGVRALFIDEARDSPVPVAAVLGDLREVAGEHFERFATRRTIAALERILEDGASAQMQLRIYNESRAAGDSAELSLRRVLLWLAAATVGLRTL